MTLIPLTVTPGLAVVTAEQWIGTRGQGGCGVTASPATAGGRPLTVEAMPWEFWITPPAVSTVATETLGTRE